MLAMQAMAQGARKVMLASPTYKVRRLLQRQPHADGPPAFLDTFVCQANTNGTQYF